MSSDTILLRKFDFFDKDVLKDPDTAQEFEQLKDIDVTCCTSGRGCLIFGDSQGDILFFDRQLKNILSLQAYAVCVQFVFQFKQSDLLITIGVDQDDGREQLIKFWKWNAADWHCCRITRAFDTSLGQISGRVPQVTCLDGHENLNFLVIGFDDGRIQLYRGDMTRERHCKTMKVHDCRRSVTGLSLKMVNTASSAGGPLSGIGVGLRGGVPFLGGRGLMGKLCIFVTTENSVLRLSLQVPVRDRDRVEVQVLHKTEGCAPGCCALTDSSTSPGKEQQFVVADSKGVYFYQVDSDTRGAWLALTGDHTHVRWFRNYLVLVDKHLVTAAVGVGAEQSTVSVFDTVNKFFACSRHVPSSVLSVLSEWNSIFIVCANKKVYHLQEKDTQTKLDILLAKKNFQLMIDIARRQGYDQERFAEIYKRYGDYLYQKGDHEAAIKEYIKTIGRLEASYVIQKYLDAARIENLAEYLEALHRAQQATEDITTLLLNCYTKLRNEEKIDEFVKAADTGDGSLEFDVENAIRVLRQSGYNKQALYLAKRCQRHNWVLRILLENLHLYSDALEYISGLGATRHTLDIVREYGKIVLNALPTETTDLLIDLTKQGGWCGEDLEQVITVFVKHRPELIRFLEHLVDHRRGHSRTPAGSDDSALCHSLLELYLAQLNHDLDPVVRAERESRALSLLSEPGLRYDRAQALVLCETHGFKEGFLYLCESSGQFTQILQVHMEAEIDEKVYQTCDKYGKQQPDLWVQALTYFAKRGPPAVKYLDQVLVHLESQALMPPLMVVEILSAHPGATVCSVKNFISRALKRDQQEIAECKAAVERLERETEEKRASVHQLKNDYKIFQITKCKLCGYDLEVPSIHFLCGHSYHEHCFEDFTNGECPLCAKENRSTMQAISLWNESARSMEQNEQLFSDLRDAAPGEGFTTVANCLSKGIFNKISLEDTISKSRGGSGAISMMVDPPARAPSPRAPLAVRPPPAWQQRASPVPATSRTSPAPPAASVASATSNLNPFGDPDVEDEDLGPNNPFGDAQSPTSDYPEELNPF